jgi:hypothetical protein
MEYKGIDDYIIEYDIDLEATEGLDYLIEVIHNDLLEALVKQDYKHALYLQNLIETKT